MTPKEEFTAMFRARKPCGAQYMPPAEFVAAINALVAQHQEAVKDEPQEQATEAA